MSDRYEIITELEMAQSSETPLAPRTASKFTQLRQLARDPQWLSEFDKSAFQRLVALLKQMSDSTAQLDVVATLANVLYLNPQLRNDEDITTLTETIPILYNMLELVSERRFNSESEYQEFLPIFRLYFFLTQNMALLPALSASVLKISGKLLNFITLSSLESKSLNSIIVEILKILYSVVHQLDDTTGIDSYFVLSCNKFNLLYAKCQNVNEYYDEILEHFGNVLMAISTDVSRNYMLNKKLFVKNQIRLMNRLFQQPRRESLVPHLLTLNLLLQIDAGEGELEKEIKNHLNLHLLHTLDQTDPNFEIVLTDLERKLHSSADLSSVLQSASQYRHQSAADQGLNTPRFEDLSDSEQDQEINKMQTLFDKIEQNGVFNIKMK